MAADLALAADPQIVDRSADPAGFVVAACERAKAWLTEALEHGEIEQIAEIKSQAEAISWMKRAPFPEGLTLVARRLYEFDDFGAAMTPELRAQEEHHREMALANARKG